MIPAEDAEIIDTTSLNPEQVVQAILATVESRGRQIP
jgi:cytidylate kinase